MAPICIWDKFQNFSFVMKSVYLPNNSLYFQLFLIFSFPVNYTYLHAQNLIFWTFIKMQIDTGPKSFESFGITHSHH